MKVISAFLALVISATAAPNDPGQVALGFLEKVRDKTLSLEPGEDTALTAQTSERKRLEIAQRIDRMAGDLGSDPLELGAVKIDGQLAAVLVRKLGGFDPSRLQIFPVALVKQGTGWLPTPVPASFENSGVRYIAQLRKQREKLEEWMLREQVTDLEMIREQSTKRMRGSIEKLLPSATLRTFSSKQTADRFIKACEERNYPEALGLLGGLSKLLPNDWPQRLRAVDAALNSISPVHPSWSLLTSPQILRTLVDHEELGTWATISIACLDPTSGKPAGSRPRIKLVHMELAKTSDGFWRVDPPDGFFSESAEHEDNTDDELDADLLNLFPTKITAQFPPSPLESVELARQSLVSSLHEGAISSMMPLIRLDPDPKTARSSCIRAAKIWWKLRNTTALHRAVPLSLQQKDSKAAASFQFFSAANPDRLNLEVLYFEQLSDGWFWTPEPPKETKDIFLDWKDQQTRQWQNTWQEALLDGCPVIKDLADAAPPSEQEARTVVNSWLTAIRNGDVTAAVRLTARLDTPDSQSTLIRNLGYELNGARRNHRESTITAIQRGESITAVGVASYPDDKASFPLYLVIQSPEGPRILPELDLFTSLNRNRKYLNSKTFERLTKFNPEASTELKTLFSRIQAETK